MRPNSSYNKLKNKDTTKKILFLLLLSIIAQVHTAENVFNKRSSWTSITYNVFDETLITISTYKLDGDTLIRDEIYSKVFVNDKFSWALRESEDNKIYVYHPAAYRESLVYDFYWYPGKTLYREIAYNVPPCYYTGCHFIQAVLPSSIDSIKLLDGKYYQYVGDYETGEAYIIRGIGRVNGRFVSLGESTADGTQHALLCFYIDDKLVYSNPKFDFCNTSSIDIVSKNSSEIKLYPNPSNHSITVEFLDNQGVDTFKIFDTKGSLVKTYEVGGKNEIEVQVQGFEKDVYVYNAILKNNQTLSGRIIIK